MREAPIPHRVGCRPAFGVDVGEHFDCGGGARGGNHALLKTFRSCLRPSACPPGQPEWAARRDVLRASVQEWTAASKLVRRPLERTPRLRRRHALLMTTALLALEKTSFEHTKDLTVENVTLFRNDKRTRGVYFRQELERAEAKLLMMSLASISSNGLN
jgi:hypothetical protein